MARSLRSPAVLMTVYAGLVAYVGPWLSLGDPDGHRNVLTLAIAVVLAVSAALGSREARVLMIGWSATGVSLMLLGSTPGTSAAVRLGSLACYLLQIALLVSSPMYQRSRPGRAPGRWPSAQFLPAPPLWTILASGTGGIVITLLPIRNLRVLPCPAVRAQVAPQPPCLADGAGYPLAFRFDGGILTMHAQSAHWLNVLAPRGIQVAALAADWAMWSLGVLLVLYLAWLSQTRDYPSPAQWQAARPSDPASQ